MFGEKRQFFNQNKQGINQIIYHLINNFDVVLDRIIFFSVQFCDNSMLVLKKRFQVFLSQVKRYKDFPMTVRY